MESAARRDICKSAIVACADVTSQNMQAKPRKGSSEKGREKRRESGKKRKDSPGKTNFALHRPVAFNIFNGRGAGTPEFGTWKLLAGNAREKRQDRCESETASLPVRKPDIVRSMFSAVEQKKTRQRRMLGSDGLYVRCKACWTQNRSTDDRVALEKIPPSSPHVCWKTLGKCKLPPKFEPRRCGRADEPILRCHPSSESSS